MKSPVLVAIGLMAVLVMATPGLCASSGTVEVYGKLGKPYLVFTVENVGYFTLDDDYLNFSVQSDPTEAGYGSGHATNATYYIIISINDGTTNKTWNKSLAVKCDVTVWANVSQADPGTIFVTNASATLGVYLPSQNAKGGNYSSAEISIFTEPMGGAILNMIPVIMVIAMVAIMLPMLAKFGKRK